MSVINTNITSMIGQSNLQKSQSALQTSMERLSSGLRINSAKDDAAGQAIANRMTAQITGLAQAQRNANDGISVAQTAEGALNQINDNLQRIRELSVQAQNDTNSSEDRESIQAEIGQRLEEINRISRETNFNGTKVLNEEQKFQIQVGANDGEVIKIDLKEITSSTLGLSGFDITNNISSDSLTKVEAGDEVDVLKAAIVQANGFEPAPGTAAQQAEGVFALKDGSGYVVKAEDGNYYNLAVNDNTGDLTWDSATAAVAEGDVETGQAVTSIDLTTDVSGANALTVEYPAGTTLADGATTIESGIYKRNDIGAESLNASGDTLTGYAVKGSDGKFYEAEITAGVGFDANDPSTWTDANLTLTVVGVDDGNGNTQAVEVSAGNIANTAAANGELVVRQEAISSNDDLRNLALDSAPTASGLYALKDGTGYVVKGSDDNYYQAAVDASGAVSWNSDTSPAIAESLIETGATVDNVKTGVVTVSLSGLADGETLLQGEDGQYFVSSENANGNMVYTKASVNGDTGEVTKLDGTQTVDALGTLDNALKAVDNLRSDLGAIQNRFESAITNLQTNETNLSAARSRIEDADYAAEVANMTRAQILQQAGTSVLAQANQIPQNVLSLLG